VSAPTISAELAAAIRRVNVAFNRLPADRRNRITIAYDPLEAEVDSAILTDDRERALAAIRAWRQHWTALIEEAGR
jgi:hypothetical protein